MQKPKTVQKKTYSKVEIKRAVDNSTVSGKTITALKRLAAYEPTLCTHFRIDPPTEKGEPWAVRSVLRDEFIEDAVVMVTIRKGVKADEAIMALKYISNIVKTAQTAAKKDQTRKKGLAMKTLPFWVKAGAMVIALFNAPVALVNYLIKLCKRK